MFKRRLLKSEKISITLPQWIIEDVDELSADVGITRSEVIADILRHVLRDEELLDEIYPFEEGYECH